EETIDYVLREMTDPAGGFYSAQDADSEGVEGKFFAWTTAQLAEVLGAEEGALMARVFGATEQGNFEHTNVLHRPADLGEIAAEMGMEEAALAARVDQARRVLFAAREQRVKPNRDDKVLAAWNGLMLRSLAEAAAVLEREDYARAAVANAAFLLRELRDGDKVLRTWKGGRAKLDGYLEDYALLADGLLAVSSLTFEPRWLREAIGVTASMVHRFWESDPGAFYDTATDAERLIVRPRDFTDNAVPAGNSVATGVLLKVAALTEDAEDHRRAEIVLAGHRDAMVRYPNAFGELLGALDLYLGPVTEIAIVGERTATDTRALLREAYARFRPVSLVIGRSPEDTESAGFTPLFEERGQRDGKATAYVCVGHTCGAPATEPEQIRGQLDATR
ncbi:MAG: thioredoxin domain-containing protein, partial [Dehalococcoidia bacterium]